MPFLNHQLVRDGKKDDRRAVAGQFNQSTDNKKKAKADSYLLVVSEAQSRHVSILLSKVGQPADHPCELVKAGRIEKRWNERGEKTQTAQQKFTGTSL